MTGLDDLKISVARDIEAYISLVGEWYGLSQERALELIVRKFIDAEREGMLKSIVGPALMELERRISEKIDVAFRALLDDMRI